ncbi:hypothetical protein F0562_012587 [Nyssa sinensis]|uniref:Chromo domain-containing protein n=1 Tax=Nyssa sinensis TaxID=561372 RepID=A0A5J4ZVP0_9ASTE|nr:hypothetical protein F0562_012587 [Nyssa sinensis]
MDQRVESLENEVGSLTAGQQQIIAQLVEIVSKLNSQTIIPPANMECEDGENLVAPLHTHGGRPGNPLEGSPDGNTTFICFKIRQTRISSLQWLKQKEDVMTWKEFTDGLYARCFISGLKDSIKADVLSGHPTNLSSTIGLARLYEARNISQQRTTPTADLKKVTNKETINTSSTLPVWRMSPTELQERRVKGLCYNYNEKFVPGHRCKKLFLIEACYEEEDGDVIIDMEESVQEDYKEVLEIFLHAISGARTPETMRVKGGVGHISTIVLVDSGSTHNFISETLARKMALQPEKGGKFEVVVASGEKLSSPDDKEVSLQGMSVPKDQIIGDLQFSREFKKSKKAVLLQLFTLGTPLPKVEVTCQPPPLQQILEEFQDVFEEPKGLPLPRAHDHKIPLMEGSGPVCVKPYRYPHYQKAEIEKLVPKEWSRWLAWAEYCYNTSWHSAIKMTPFEVVYGRPPPTLLSYIPGMAKVDAVEKQLMDCDKIIKDLRATLKESQSRMKKVYDRHHREREFEEGDWVYLKLHPYRQASIAMRKNLKLSPKYYGPFQIAKKIGAVAYKLDLPKDSRIHPIFHVSLLKKKIGENLLVQSMLPIVRSEDGILVSKPQAVLDRRVRKKKDEVLIHWQGLSPAEATWEDLVTMKQQFPEYCLKDKAAF